MSTTTQTVNYEQAARRHLADAETLFNHGRMPNAGQLYGFVAECGLKAMLLACGVARDTDGGIPARHPTKPKDIHPLRRHMPNLADRIASHGQLIPDGQQANMYMSSMPNLGLFSDWSVDHRYCSDAAAPVTAVLNWRHAAKEVSTMLDQAKQDGVLS
jgi:hypothetical protein